MIDDTQLMQEQMKGGMGAPQDINKVYQSEKEHLELGQYRWELDDIEKKLIGLNKQKKEDPEQKRIKEIKLNIAKRQNAERKKK